MGKRGRKPRVVVEEVLMSREERLAALDAREKELDEKMALYREQNKIEFFKPIEPYQVMFLEHLYSGRKVISLVGGNGIGKTTLGAVVVASACLGVQPWDGKVLPAPLSKPPIKVRIICSDWEKHAGTVIVPKLKEYLPVGQYTTGKNNVGVESVFTFKNKSTIELITNKQATIDHSGWEGDLIWGDEPFDRDKYIENLRGLRRPPERGGMGVFLMTMTAVSASWVLDDIILNTDPAYASITEIPQDANPYLTEEYKRIFRASMTEDEKVARIYGGWLNLTGLVLKGFKSAVHLIKPFEVPTDWPVVAMIDFHLKNPISIGFYAVDPRGITYVVEEIWKNMVAEESADEIIRRKKIKGWRIEDAYIDPLSKGDTNYVKNMTNDIPADTFTRMKERLYKEGIELKVASKDKDSGVKNVEDMLVGVNGMPTLFFFNNLNEIGKKEGHIWEIQRWTYDEDQKPKKENDHFMENLYRMTLTGTKYSDLRRTNNVRSELEFDVFQPNYGIRESQTEFNVWAR